VPLTYASSEQTVLRLSRLMERLSAKDAGLVTPIEVERFSNGVRIVFVTRNESYQSSWSEERLAEKDRDVPSMKMGTVGSKSGYMSPEKEAAALARVDDAPVKNKPKLKRKPEGGLELIVDSLPYKRVRVRRCNLGPDTIVKEESEALIVKEISRALNTLESDYKILLRKSE
jgi:hypothetical protein